MQEACNKHIPTELRFLPPTVGGWVLTEDVELDLRPDRLLPDAVVGHADVDPLVAPLHRRQGQRLAALAQAAAGEVLAVLGKRTRTSCFFI